MNIKMNFILIASFAGLFSCAPKGSTIECEEFNAELVVKECISDKTLPDGAYFGEVVAYKGKNKIEENMLSQFASMNLACLRGDYDNVCRYLYQDAAKYYRKFYPGESDDAIMRGFFSSMSDEMIQTMRNYEEHGIELSIVVSRVIRKVAQDDNIIYVFEIVSNMISDNLQVHTDPDQTIAVSTNGGKNWTFNAFNDDVPNILRISYSEDVVDKVMGY